VKVHWPQPTLRVGLALADTQGVAANDETTTLWRPCGPEELALVEASDWKTWPPRLPEQPRYDVHQAGGRTILEYWIPAEDLEELNANILGRIEVVAEFRDPA
jgi:hypothetical protein